MAQLALTPPLAIYSAAMSFVNIWAIILFAVFFKERGGLRQLILFFGALDLLSQQVFNILLPILPANTTYHLLSLLPSGIFYFAVLYWMVKMCIYYESGPPFMNCCSCSPVVKCFVALLLLVGVFFGSWALHSIPSGLSNTTLTEMHTAEAVLTLIMIALILRVTYLQDDLRLQSHVGAQTAPILRRLRRLVPFILLELVVLIAMHILIRTHFQSISDDFHFPFLVADSTLNWPTVLFALIFETLPTILYLIAFSAPSATMALTRLPLAKPPNLAKPGSKGSIHESETASSGGEVFDLQSPWMSSAGSSEPPEWLRSSFNPTSQTPLKRSNTPIVI
eukprot:TRINITY_DN4066_c0_g1_i1.p1 TRINITY_DN4066_c0_g1~~TRINITY_DN4066_c0_g1_i1.p1  ORF type:complete len:336 (-),score=50.44 TRINITY_DN4066_c0_g1_i1:152-1159(-)